jgi:hypothetical protein
MADFIFDLYFSFLMFQAFPAPSFLQVLRYFQPFPQKLNLLPSKTIFLYLFKTTLMARATPFSHHLQMELLR